MKLSREEIELLQKIALGSSSFHTAPELYSLYEKGLIDIRNNLTRQGMYVFKFLFELSKTVEKELYRLETRGVKSAYISSAIGRGVLVKNLLELIKDF